MELLLIFLVLDIWDVGVHEERIAGEFTLEEELFLLL